MQLYIHEISIKDDGDFSRRFNYVSWLWAQSCSLSRGEDEKDYYRKEHWSAKYCLEQGLPVSFLEEYENK